MNMSPGKSELENFHWHCEVVALLVRSFPLNPATKSNISHAVRMATLCCTGKSGIRYATRRAYELQRESGKGWYELGLIREHVFPVSEVVKNVVRDITAGAGNTWASASECLAPEDLRRWEAPADSAATAPYPAVVAASVRKYSLIAWASGDDDALLRRAGLAKRMPVTFDGSDLFARYKHCKIDLIDLSLNVAI